MTGKPLAKLYDQLTAAERFPLMLAAFQRGDDAEGKRLAASAPRRAFSARDFHCVANAHLAMIAFQQIERLCVGGWFLRFLAASREAERDGNAADFERTENVAVVFAWRFKLDEEAWRLFCEEKTFAAYDEGIPGEDLIATVRRLMADSTHSAEDAAHAANCEVSELPTLKSRLKDLRDEWAFWEHLFSPREF